MKFLIQKVKNEIVYDFAFELIRSKEFYDWLGEGEFEIEYAYDLLWPKQCGGLGGESDFRNWVPVGSVEFVSRYLLYHAPQQEHMLYPLNVPPCLFKYSGRLISNVINPNDMVKFDLEYLKRGSTKVFRKSMHKIKSKENGLFDYDCTFEKFQGFQISEYLDDIDSEWRVFVFKHQVLHLSNYSGSSLIFPNPDTILEIVEEYKKSRKAPIAYTLDLGVRDNKTFVIECHRFFSCGLYGFSDYARYPKMLSQTWQEMCYTKEIK